MVVFRLSGMLRVIINVEAHAACTLSDGKHNSNNNNNNNNNNSNNNNNNNPRDRRETLVQL